MSISHSFCHAKLILPIFLVCGLPAVALAAPIYDLTYIPPPPDDPNAMYVDRGITPTSISNRGTVGIAQANTLFFDFPKGGYLRGEGGQELARGALYNSINSYEAVAITQIDIPHNPRAGVLQFGIVQLLPTPRNHGSTALSINDAGWVAGNVVQEAGLSSPRAVSHAVLWRGSSVLELDKPSDYSSAVDLNDRGQVVGYLNGRPFVWEQRILRLLPLDRVEAINASGAIAGGQIAVGQEDGRHHAAIWHNGTVTDLGTLPGGWSEATDINDAGQVVGYDFVDEPRTFLGYGLSHAVIWLDGKELDLNTLTASLPEGLLLNYARGVNDRGQIVGEAFDSLRETFGVFILTPRQSTDALLSLELHTDAFATPEPTPWIWAGAGLLMIGCCFKHAQRSRSVQS